MSIAKKVQLLNEGQSYIKHIESSAVDELVRFRQIFGIHRVQPDQGGGCSDHLRADPAEQESRAGYLVRS